MVEATSQVRSGAQVPRERVGTFHLDPATAERVRDWFATDGVLAELDGVRSVRMVDPDRPDRLLKIKGAGLRGGPIRFGTLHNSRLKAPVFDFDGRMMEDVASGHDAAWRGGASFQQAVVEYRITARMAALGIPVVPCLGYGHVEKEGLRSWFAVFGWESDWAAVTPAWASAEEIAEASESRGRLQLDLACRHDLIGYFWYAGTRDRRRLVKDVHPFRQADPVSMSQLSWVMQVIFALHIPALAAVNFARRAGWRELPENFQARGFRAALADATTADHEDLRWTIVAPYMLGPPAGFDPGALHAALRRNRIADALLDLCPETYARY